MCYAIPGRLIKINKNIGIVDYFGERREAHIDLIDANIGDYVYAQGGILISKISEKEALIIIDTWKELFLKLKKVDKTLSKMKDPAIKIFQKFNKTNKLCKTDALTLMNLRNPGKLKILYKFA